jgi:hypothetical protein
MGVSEFLSVHPLWEPANIIEDKITVLPADCIHVLTSRMFSSHLRQVATWFCLLSVSVPSGTSNGFNREPVSLLPVASLPSDSLAVNLIFFSNDICGYLMVIYSEKSYRSVVHVVK